MKRLFFVAVAVLSIAACSKNVVDNQSEEAAVSFGVYVPTTKAGTPGTMNLAALKTSGFGVFAYYTDNSAYAAGTTTPNFMYNQKVSGDNWSYSPLKYWPNEYGEGTSEVDKVSFFAYAPYVASTGAGVVTGAEDGITGFTANTATTDPAVSYKVPSDPANTVDLLWAVVGSEGYTDPKTGAKTAGLPFMNLTKPSTTQKVNFFFKHALTRVGVTIQGAFDSKDAGVGVLDASTKITVASIDILGAFAGNGTLSLDNSTANVPSWTATTGTTEWNIANADIADNLADSGVNEMQTVTGVTATPVSVFTGTAFAASEGKYFTAIPLGAKTATVNIVYYVNTVDSALASGYSRIKNDITKTVSVNLVAGKINLINIVLGMTSAKLTATTEDWGNVTSSDVQLPSNN